MSKNHQQEEIYSKDEADRRRDAALRNALGTPPKKHAPIGKKKVTRPPQANPS